MVAVQPLVSEFTIVGRLVDFVVSKSDRVRYLQLSTQEAEYSIEVAKESKKLLSKHLKPGCWLKITGMRKYELHQGEVKYKAYTIELLPEQVDIQTASSNSTTTTKPKVKVLICQSSTCWKNGGKAACNMLKAELQAKGIAEQVEVRTTGCLKQCKQAPNLVIMPGGNRYSRVQPKQISELITKHLL